MDVIIMRCPECGREQAAPAEPSDPIGTIVVQSICDRCDDGGGFPETHYFDHAYPVNAHKR